MEAYVAQEVLARLDTPEVMQALRRENHGTDANQATTKLIALKARRQEIIDNLGHGEIEVADFKALLAASDEAIADVKAQLPKASPVGAAAALRGVDRVRDRWESSSLDWRRSVTQLVVERVELLEGGHSGFATWNGWRFKPEAIRITWKEIASADVAADLSVLMRTASLRRRHLALAA